MHMHTADTNVIHHYNDCKLLNDFPGLQPDRYFLRVFFSQIDELHSTLETVWWFSNRDYKVWNASSFESKTHLKNK